MKNTKRRLMSLLLALALVCTMIPAAMAAYEFSSNYGLHSIQQNVSIASGGSTSVSTIFPTTTYYNGWPVTFTGNVIWSGGSDNVTVTGSGQNAVISVDPNTYYGHYSTVTALATYTVAGPVPYTITIPHTYDVSVGYTTQTYAPVVNGNTSGSIVGGTGSVGGTSSGAYVTSLSQGTMSVAVGSGGSLTVTPSYGATITSVVWSSSNTSVATVSGYSTTTSVYGVSAGQAAITASVTGYYYSGSSQIPFTNVLGCTVTVGTGYGYGTGADSGHFYLSSSNLLLSGSGDYALLSATPYSGSAYSASQLQSLTWYSSNPGVAAVSTTGTNSTTGSSAYIYAVGNGTTTIYAQLSSSVYAYCTVTVGGGSSMDILYNVTTGQSKALNVSDFQQFWASKVGSTGTLERVVFGTASGSVGRLTYVPSYGSATQTTVTSGLSFYVSPTTTLQNSLSTVTFTPTSTLSTYTGTLTVPFTAYGTSSYYSTSTTSYSGNLYISVTSGAVQSISYQASGSAVSLNPADFVSVYKQSVSTSIVAPTMYIRLLEVPAFGSLYYNNYGSSYYYGNTGTKLTSSLIGSLFFSSAATAATSIDDLSYVPSVTGASETIRYAAYSSPSGSPLYVGEITFTAGKAPAAMKYYTTAGNAITLDHDDITDAIAGTYNYIALGSPTNGKLYKNYNGSTGTMVTTGETFTLSDIGSGVMSSLNTVSAVPTATGVMRIPFTVSTYLGGQYTGTIEVYAAKTFTDVKTTNWAYPFIAQLTAEGIVDGYTATTFAPSQKLKYGEALKLIMEAAGYSKQVKTSTHWASGYLAAAYRDGLVSSNSIDLESYIDRNTVAVIAAKALGLSQASRVNAGISDPCDSSNGYVYALYNAGILTGENRGGKNYFDGSTTLTRAQVCAIVCRVSDYK